MLACRICRHSARLRPTAARPPIGSAMRYGRPRRRSYSSSAAASPAPIPATPAAMLAPLKGDLDRIAPKFHINGDRIRVLRSPTEFYETLKDKIRNAESRIFLSTLYVGKTETELIATLQEALRAKPKLKLYILTDALRGTRESPQASCATLLAPLVSEFGPDRVEIRMYHTPNLTGLRKKHMPKRINEGWGLQHMKLYGVDDEIILSGANLSNDYFTNRQDRYHLFASKDITSYFWSLYSGVASLSFKIKPSNEAPDGFEMTWPISNPAPSPLEHPHNYVNKATSVMAPLISAPATPIGSAIPEAATDKADTTVYAISQFSQLLKPDTSTELPALTLVLRALASPTFQQSSWTFTAGYFNPAPSLTKLLLSTASHRGTIITASPLANGFYKSPGVSGLLPDAYTYLAHRFLRSAHAHGRENAITLKEWAKGAVNEPGGWTYHAKGLWVTLPGQKHPSLSLIGSSNYTKRSYGLDLESNALIVTKNEGLMQRLDEEQNWLQEHAKVVTRDDFAKNEKRVSFKVRIAMWIVSLVGGAL